MKGESFFEAFGKINEKYAKSAESRFYISERREKAQNAAKIIGTVVSVAAVIAIILAIWIPSVIFRDPPISPIDSDTGIAHITETDAATETDTTPGTDTEAVITDTPSTDPPETEPHSTEEHATEPPETEPAFGDWNELDKTEKIQRAMYDITHYGVTYQRWRYLCGAEYAEDIHDDGGYNIDDKDEAEFTYDYLLGLYDGETDKLQKKLMFVFISTYLTETWDDSERVIPWSRKHYAQMEEFNKRSLDHFRSLPFDTGCDDYLQNYYKSFCRYAAYMTEDEVKTKYAPSYKLIKKFGFNNFADSAKTFDEKARRNINEFFNMAMSVKYGIEFDDMSSKIHYIGPEGDGGGTYVYKPGDSVYEAITKYYSEDQLYGIAAYEQRPGINTIDKWLSYFRSIASDSIADGFVKESACFFTTTDGIVLTCRMRYSEFPPEGPREPYISDLEEISSENGKTTYTIYVTDACGSSSYSVEVSSDCKITGGTFIEKLMRSEEFDDPKTFMQSVFDAMRLPGTGDEAYYMSRPESCGAPQELVDIAKKYFGERAAQQLYYSYNGISDVSYFRNKARAFFAEDTLRELYDKNEKAFVKIGKTLYVNGDLEDINFLEVTEISRCEKVRENEYEIELAVMNCGELNPRGVYFTARLQIVSGRPVITGGTFLDFIFEEMLVK